MAIQKMKLISIAGPKNDFERVVSKYLLINDLHLENAMSMLNNVKGLQPFDVDNSFSEPIKKVEEMFSIADIDISKKALENFEDDDKAILGCSEEEIDARICKISNMLEENTHQINEIAGKLNENDQILEQLEHLCSLDVDLDRLFKLSFIKIRFGRLPKAGYEKLKSYLQDINAFFIEGDTDPDYVYGFYLMPAAEEEKIDAIFLSLYFERIIISGKSHGTPHGAYTTFSDERERLLLENELLKQEAKRIISGHEEELIAIYKRLLIQRQTETIKKYSAHTKESFYILAWSASDTARELTEELEDEKSVVVVEEEPKIIKKVSPPVKLKNFALFRPFKMFIEMYGLPSYTELDPTPLLAFTYVLMFGIMFGDVGHGLVLLIGGLIVYKIKKMDLAAILAQTGLFSIIFGFIYGNIFGNEEILHEIAFTRRLFVINPMKDIFTILILSVALGVVIILVSMVMNVINCIKSRNVGKALFDRNGLAGIIFYGYAIFLAASMFFIKIKIPTAVTAVMITVPLIVIFFSEPLSKLIEGRKDWMPKNMGEYIMETFFELFEIVLSYITNTISFVRLGAFALGHGSMMSVVFILAEMTSGVGSAIVFLLGNILVIALEGLVVGIQALRLEFYEMFSRYYIGDGRPFKSIKQIGAPN